MKPCQPGQPCPLPVEILSRSDLLHHLAERRNERLRQPEAEHQLGTRHEHLGRQPLKERSKPLILHHLAHNPEAALGVIEIPILNARLDDIQGCRNDQRSRRARDGSHEILRPRRLVVVLELEQLLLRPRATSEERKGARSVTRGRPARTAVQAHSLIGDDAHEAAVAESFWVGLALDLEHVEGQQDDLADADERAGRGVQDGFAGALAEGAVEFGGVVLREVVAHERLAAVLVYPLQDFVAGRVPETGEEGGELGGE